MDLRDTPAEAELRAEVRGWLEQHWRDDMPREDWYTVLAETGWAAPMWPQQYGGRGATPSEAIIFHQERQKLGTLPPPSGIGVPMAGPTIIVHGDEEQKARFLPPMLRNDEIWCQLFSEPGAGSDLAAIQARAELDGDEWVVNGQKVWTSFAHEARWGILLARHDTGVPKHLGISYFICDMQAPGIEVVPLREMSGEALFNEVFLNDVRIPNELLVGQPGDGWKAAMTTLANERVALGMSGLGASREGDELDLAEADEDSAFATMGLFVQRGANALIELVKRSGRAGDPSIRAELARLYTLYEVNRYTGYRIQTALMQGKGPGAESSTGKLAYTQLVKGVADFLVKLAGPAGLAAPDDNKLAKVAERMLLVVPATSIYGGSDEIQKNIVSERVLGMPKEPRADAEIPFNEIRKAAAK